MNERMKTNIIKLILLSCTFLLIFFISTSKKGYIIGVIVLINIFIVLALSSNKGGKVKESAGKKFICGIIALIPIMIVGFYNNYFIKILLFVIISIFILLEEKIEELYFFSKKYKNK